MNNTHTISSDHPNSGGRLLLTWLCISFALMFSGLLLFESRPRLMNVLDVVFFLPALVYCLIKSENRLKAFIQNKAALIAFLLYASFSTFLSESPNPSRFFRALIEIYVLFVFLEYMARHHERTLLQALLFGIAAATLTMAVDFYAYYFMLDKPFSHQLYGWHETFHVNDYITLATNQLYASVYFICLPFFIFFAVRKLELRGTLKLMAILLCALIVVYLLSMQRRSTIAALAGATLLLPLLTGRIRLIIPFVLVGLGVALMLLVQPDFLVRRGLSQRPEIWAKTWEFIMNAPVFGHGMANATPMIETSLFQDGKRLIYDHPHNYYLSLLYYVGFAGLLLWTGIWFRQALFTALRPGANSLLIAGMSAGFAAILFDGIHPYTPFQYNWGSVWFPMAMLNAFALAQRQREEHTLKAGFDSDEPLRVVQICKYRNKKVDQLDLFEEVVNALQGHRVSFYILAGAERNLGSRLGCDVVPLNLGKRELKKNRLSGLRKLWRQLREDNPQVIITHRTKPAVMTTLVSPFLPPAKKIAVIHGMGQFRKTRQKLFARLFMRRNWQMVAVSEAVRGDLLDAGFHDSQITVIKNAIDEQVVRDNALTRRQAREALGLENNDVRLCGMVSRIHRVKGHEFVLRALQQAKSPARVAALGDGELLEGLSRRTEEEGLSQKLLFLGGVPNAYRYMKAFDALIMPSLSEGLPMAMLEAIAAGVPAFGTPVGGIPEILKDDAWRFPPRDPVALAAVLDRIGSASEEELAGIAEQQYAIFKAEFSIENYRAAFRRLVESG
jgi:glycosyltransferase involved in cell wall biosynthesis